MKNMKSNSHLIKFVKDSFVNVIKGLGTSKDPTTATYFTTGRYITQKEANDLYVYNWLAAKIVDIPIDDATRKWRTLLIEDSKKKKDVEDAMVYYDVKEKLTTAMKWSRVFGGSVIIAVMNNEDLEMPMDLTKIKKGSLSHFIVLDRHNVYHGPIDRKILSNNFGLPEFFTVSRQGQQIHHTRLLKFPGILSTLQETERRNYWGSSIFTKGWEPIRDSQTVSRSIAALIYEANVDIYKIKNLHQLVAENKDAIVTKRLQIVHQMKSMLNGVVLDKDEEYDKKQNSFMQLAQIDDRFIQKVSGMSDIPVTRLLGTSPTGLNATGESDMLNYYDNVQSKQENDIRPKLSWMDAIVMATTFGDTDPLEYEWKPLKQLTEIEQSTVENTNADRDLKYLSEGVILRTDVLSELSENGTYGTIDANRVDEEIKSGELDELDIVEPQEPEEGDEPGEGEGDE